MIASDKATNTRCLSPWVLPCFVLVAAILSGCNNLEHSENTPPYTRDSVLTTPVVFAEGMITTMNGIQFSRDGRTLYTSALTQDTFWNGRQFAQILQHTWRDTGWGTPVPVRFKRAIDAYHPVLSYDDSLLYFNSRSHPDSASQSVPHDIWFATHSDSGWTQPRRPPSVNSAYYDSYPSLAKNGNLYFNSDRPGGKGSMDIYLARYEDGQYATPENLQELNSEHAENDLVVDPGERFIIFNRYVEATHSLDMWIAYRRDGAWSAPRPLDAVNTPSDWELTPTLSPDGRYFFYELNGRIMQISLSVLHGE